MIQRYLPLQGLDGRWIVRADLFVLARMSYQDAEEDAVVQQLYETLSNAKNNSEKLNTFEAVIEKRQIRQNLRQRWFAGLTVLELVRLAATTGNAPTASQGIRLVAFNQHRLEGRRATGESLEREVRKGFSQYRNTAHLQAAIIVADPSVSDIEISEEYMVAFLARARGLEVFIDNNVAQGDFRWQPWRVPTTINPLFSIKIRRLSTEERAAAGLS